MVLQLNKSGTIFDLIHTRIILVRPTHYRFLLACMHMNKIEGHSTPPTQIKNILRHRNIQQEKTWCVVVLQTNI